MIVIFLVDSSASMNQKFSNGMSALECTKSCIEHLAKHLPHVKPAEKHNDKFMLVTYEEGPGCVKSSLKDPLSHLIKELKVLKASDMSNPGASLSTIFDILNMHRVQHGLDTPASLNIPGITSAGVDYYHEPFRWDQRLYTIFLEPNVEVVDPQLSILSTVMGGTSYRVRTLRHMLQAMDCMLGISKIPPTQYSPQAVLHIYGVVVNFEDLIVYVNPTWLSPATRHSGFFPIPESFWADADTPRIPTRNAQPTLHYHTKEEKTVEIPDGFPYDKYVVAPCPMTQELLTRPPGSCWPVYIKNSYKTEGFGFPFGFLKANTNKNAVTLTVVAYNYPALFTLLVNFNSIPGRIPTPEWLRDFSEYLSHTPSYYYTPLRNAFKRMSIFNVIPAEQAALSASVQKIINKNKMQAKSELDRFLISDASAAVETIGFKKKALCANAFDVPRSDLISVLGDLKRSFFKELQISALSMSISLSQDSPSSISQPLSRLTPGVTKLGASRMDLLVDSDDLHSLPIADMGIYQDRMQKIQQENLRDPFRDEESAKSLQRTMFGNPYKQDKKVSIDEEDEAPAADSSTASGNTVGGSSWSSILGRRRKPRRRSVSPSPFPIEKIPSLARGDRSVSGKAQVLSLGASGSRIPMLRITVHDGSGILQQAEPSEGLSRHVVMHDGEDEDEEDEEFRRAMFNSDEMELDGDDEAARLRADTPMPGGMGLDDDDEDMEDMQRAQEMIPPPIMAISLDDIDAEISNSAYRNDEDSRSDVSDDSRFDEHRESLKEDLDQLNGKSIPVFESIVYDPTSLMELQSIPHLIPERTAAASTPPLQTNGTKLTSSPVKARVEQDRQPGTNDAAMEANGNSHLTPIPLLMSPFEDAAGSFRTTTGSRDGKMDDLSIHHSPSLPSSRAQAGKSSLHPTLPEPLQSTPQELKIILVKHLKQRPIEYNQSAILDMVSKIDDAPNWTKQQKRNVLSTALVLAKGFRRAPVVSALDMALDKLK
ncbi:Integrator complex subunit 6 [Dissophora globulifera]|nr:Integrator complex subunit 6 [Dissophora globulifera]